MRWKQVQSCYKSFYRLAAVCLLLFICAISSCKKKESALDVSAIVCKNFKLSGSKYQKIVDASCTGIVRGGKLRISCNYDGNADCIKRIKVNAQFYKADNVAIDSVSYPMALNVSDSRVAVSGNEISFVFDYSYEGKTNPKSLNFIYLNYYIENDNGDASNKAQLRVDSDCSFLDTTTYKVVKTFKVSSDTLDVTLWDAVKEDGDLVSLWLNDTLKLDNYVLTKAEKTFRYKLKLGNNRLILFAITEGGVASNTPAVRLNRIYPMNLLPTLLFGQAIDINYTP